MNFNITFDMTCSTEYLLYILTCMGCNEYCVGQTVIEGKEQRTQTTRPAP